MAKLSDKIVFVSRNRTIEMPLSHIGAISIIATVLNTDIDFDEIMDLWLDGNNEIEVDDDTMKTLIIFGGLIESGIQINK